MREINTHIETSTLNSNVIETINYILKLKEIDLPFGAYALTSDVNITNISLGDRDYEIRINYETDSLVSINISNIKSITIEIVDNKFILMCTHKGALDYVIHSMSRILRKYKEYAEEVPKHFMLYNCKDILCN